VQFRLSRSAFFFLKKYAASLIWHSYFEIEKESR